MIVIFEYPTIRDKSIHISVEPDSESALVKAIAKTLKTLGINNPVVSEPPMTKVTGFPFFRNGTTFLTIRVISQLEGMTPLSHRNIPKIRKSLNTLT